MLIPARSALGYSRVKCWPCLIFGNDGMSLLTLVRSPSRDRTVLMRHRIVFTQNVTDNLRDLLEGRTSLDTNSDPATKQVVMEEKPRAEGQGEMKGFKPSGFKSSFKPAAPTLPAPADPEHDDADVDGQEMDMDTEVVDGEALVADVDGEALEEDVDGEALDDVDGEALDDVDGAPMEMDKEEDTDGEPL